MIGNFLFICSQSAVLFLLMIIGFFASKFGLINAEGEKTLTNLMLYLAVPCVILRSFSEGFNKDWVYGFLICLAISLITYLISIILATLTLRHKNKEYEDTVRFCTIFANVGLFCIPIAGSMFGEEGVFYCISQMVLFNIISWTYGYWLMGKDSSHRLNFSLKKILLNPGVLFVFVGLLLFFSSIQLPSILADAIDYVAGIYVPVGMIIIGHRIAISGFSILKQKDIHWRGTLEKLVIIPALVMLCLYFAGIKGYAAIIAIMAACAPAGSTVTMFAILFGHDEDTSAGIVTYQTLLALVTVPIFLTIAQTLLN